LLDFGGDMIWTTLAHPVIAHSRIIELLQAHRFTGWRTYPVEVHEKSGRRLPDYFGLAIVGRCGSGDLGSSEIELRKFPGGWVPHFRGHYFTPETWDGSDLFMERPDPLGDRTATRFVTGSVLRALNKAKVKNVRLGRLNEECVGTSVYTIGRRHLLPPDFEARLATAYEQAGVPRPHWV
jgi:hypothetical protein